MSHQDRQEIPERAPTTRSAVTNGSKLLRGDQRGPSARRYRDLVETFGAEAGGFHQLAESGKQLVRRLASITATLEDLEADRVADKPVDPVVFCRLVGNQRRLLKDLARLAAAFAKPDSRETLAAIIAKHGQPAEAA